MIGNLGPGGHLPAFLSSNDRRPLKTGGGGGRFDDMEGRVARLEADVAHLVKQVDRIDARLVSVESDVGTMKVSLATLTERVAHLPSKGFVVTSTITSIVALTAILTLLSKLGILAAG